MKKALSCLTIFWGSFLLFGVQPLVGNTLLPVFGGTAAVWTVCLCAFQVLLLAGYGYAHLMASRGSGTLTFSRRRLGVHVSLLLATAAWVAVVAWRRRELLGWATDAGYPAVSALCAVVLLVGAPYVLLSANSSLVQACGAQAWGTSVYKLYALSNAGSLCGLLAYPLVVEPFTGLAGQWAAFAGGLAAYGALLAVLAWCSGGTSSVPPVQECRQDCSSPCETRTANREARPVEWLALSALSCFLLNAVTAHLCNDVTPLPLLWAVLLAIYLLSYVCGFTDRGARLAHVAAIAVVPVVVAAAWHLGMPNDKGHGFLLELVMGGALIALGGWAIHGRLYRLRPDGSRLTGYYLAIALGGAVGGSLASLAFPHVFNFIAEYPAALLAVAYLSLVDIADLFKRWGGKGLDWRYAAVLLGGLGAFLCTRTPPAGGTVVMRMRNFYGCGRVIRRTMHVVGGMDYEANVFEHAGIVHGFQPLDPVQRRTPTLCFTPHAGGLGIVKHEKYASGEPMRVAVAGMGVGTLAAYARPNDVYRFYEINPQVAAMAANTNLFWYLSDCKAAKLDVVVDDARHALEEERRRGDEKWDVLIIDVFSGDAIPPHMSTKEAVALYLDRMAPDGVLAFHLTNWHLSLSPMAKAAAREFGLHLQGLGCWPDKYSMGSYWTWFTRKPRDFYIEGKHGRVDFDRIRDIPLMTDEKHSLIPYLSGSPMPDFD